MTQLSPLEARIGAIISAYADRAPTAIDAMAVAHRAAAASGGPPAAPWATSAVPRGLAFALLIAALLVALTATAFVAGGRSDRRGIVDVLTGHEFVEPFVGLPPEGAAPSSPETGELVLRSGARIRSIGGDVHQMWLYADGRLIWGRSLEGDHNAAWRSAFGRTEPLERAMMEQHLTRDGVSILLSHVVASTSPTEPVEWPGCVAPPDVCRGRPGLRWGGITIRDGDSMQDLSWSDPDLPGRLADPGSWLPASAWADREIRGYVPTRYAACLGSGVLELLPAAARDILLASGTPDSHDCYRIETADARAVAGILDDSGFPRADHHSLLEYQVPPTDWWNRIGFTPMTPNGDVAGWGG